MFRTAVLACKPCAQETAEGGLCDGSQPGKHSNTLSKRNKKEGRRGGTKGAHFPSSRSLPTYTLKVNIQNL